MSALRELPESSVKIGKRFRKDLGDLGDLTESIRAVGLIQRIIVDKDHNLIVGHRRFEAFKIAKPGTSIPVVVVDTLDDAATRLIAERDENTCRKEMVASELFDLGKAIEKLEAPMAAERRRVLGKGTSASTCISSGTTREKVGEALGISGETFRKLNILGEAAATGDEDAVAALERIDNGESSIFREHEARRDAPVRDWSAENKRKKHRDDPAPSARPWTRGKATAAASVLANLVAISQSIASLDVSEYHASQEEAEGLDRTIKALQKLRRSLLIQE